MEQIELETAISELEDRVERLRVLYDQYFNGFEKLEPLIPRKDVDRRIWLLRREQIRNTGLRFRFNQIVSRLNTFGMYWQRIVRQIEAGTFKRDLVKAEKRFGKEALTNAAKRKLGKKADAVDDDQKDTNPPPSQGASAPTDPFDDRFATVPGGFQPAAGTLAPPARPKSVAKLELDLDDDDDDDELFAGLDLNAPAPPVRPAAPARPYGPPTAPPAAAKPPPPSGPRPMPSSAPRAVPSSAPISSGLASSPKAPPPSDPRPSGPPSVRTPAAAPSAPAQPVVRSGLAASNPFGGVRSGIAGNMARPQPAPAAPAPKPATVAPAPAPKPAPVAPVPAPAPKPAPAAGGLGADRVQDLYAKYVAAKKQCNEPTHAITTENVAKSLGESAAKLRQKHGKDVDFDVVVKDGKAIFKPILK